MRQALNRAVSALEGARRRFWWRCARKAAFWADLKICDRKGQPLRGIDLLSDVKHAFPALPLDVVFDVGAHHGQSTSAYLERWRVTRCYAFEPSPSSFPLLYDRFRYDSRVRPYQRALGAVPGEAVLMSPAKGSLASKTTRVRLGDVVHDDRSTRTVSAESERVVVDTVDAICASEGLPTLTLLKIDAEGCDLEVLRGASGMLSAGRIELVQVEVGIDVDNELHRPLDEVKEYLEALDYRLFALYSQTSEWTTRSAHLRRVDAVFVRRTLALGAMEGVDEN